jgi:hypothetical protein
MRIMSARACTRFLTRSLLREKAHVPARAPARKARAGTRTQNGRYSTRIAYDNTRERLRKILILNFFIALLTSVIGFKESVQVSAVNTDLFGEKRKVAPPLSVKAWPRCCRKCRFQRCHSIEKMDELTQIHS